MYMYIVAGIKEYDFIASKEKTLVNFDCGRPDVPQLSGTGSAYIFNRSELEQLLVHADFSLAKLNIFFFLLQQTGFHGVAC